MDRKYSPQRFVWPKTLPQLSEEKKRISDDFMRSWHEVLPAKYGMVERFNHGYPLRILPDMETMRTLEIGAGLGEHVAHENLQNQEYHCVELRENMVSEIRRRFPGVISVAADCQTALPYRDQMFDRVLAIHVLEHLPDLPAAITEIIRVLKRGGIFSIVIPCDPGILYSFARKISAERIFRKRYGMSYGWLIRREHINSPAEILSAIDRNFVEIDRCYFPSLVPIISANVCLGVTYRRVA